MSMKGGFEARDSGRRFEEKFFGEPTLEPDFLLEIDELPRGRRARFRDDNDAYELLKKNYLDDPTNPPAEGARELRLAVMESLGLNDDEADGLKIYSALHTDIDRYLGVDGFIELRDPRTGVTRRVTLDVTLRKEKLEEGWKADVIIGELPDAVQESDLYLEAMANYGHQVAMKFQRAEGKQAAA